MLTFFKFYACFLCLSTLSYGPTVSTQDKWTPLHYASQNGHTEVAALLVQGGADVNARTKVSDSRLSRG